MNAPRGRFITLEGIEGVGKSSAVTVVRNVLVNLGYDVVVTREPGGTPLGERIREVVLDGNAGAVDPMAELLLMFAARAQHLAELIEPALAAGRCVVCDRFTDATFAYQGGGRGLADAWIERAADLVHPELAPDLTLLLDAPPEIALRRAHSRAADQGEDSDRFEREKVDFFERVRAAYLSLAERNPARFRVIDAAPTIDVVAGSLMKLLEDEFA